MTMLMYLFSLFYDFYSPFYRYYCESYVLFFWSYVKVVLAFRRRVLRFFSFLALGGFFVLVWFCDVVVHQPTLEALACFLGLAPIYLLTSLLLALMVFSLALPPRWRLGFLAFLGSFCYFVLQNFILGRGVYYNNLLLNLAVTAVDAVVEEPAGVMHNIHLWICAHPYLTMGIVIVVTAGVTLGVMVITQGQQLQEQEKIVNLQAEALVALDDKLKEQGELIDKQGSALKEQDDLLAQQTNYLTELTAKHTLDLKEKGDLLAQHHRNLRVQSGLLSKQTTDLKELTAKEGRDFAIMDKRVDETQERVPVIVTTMLDNWVGPLRTAVSKMQQEIAIIKSQLGL